MKKYIALAWVCLALTDVMAQKQKVVEKVVDEDYYPVEGCGRYPETYESECDDR